MKTRWHHQQAAFEFVGRLWNTGSTGAMLAMAMGCISGDAELTINRAGGARRIKMRDLFFKFHGGGKSWDPAIPTCVRSLIEGELRLNQIIGVIAQGIRPVLRVTLNSGKQIRTTADHQFAGPGEMWKRADQLAPGMEILTNGIAACRNCGSTTKIVVDPHAKYRGLCRTCAYCQRPKRLAPLRLSTEGVPICRNCGGSKNVATGRSAIHRGLCMTCIYSQRPRPGYTKQSVIDKDGYVRLYAMFDHPRANKAGQVYEHIVVMEKALGRPISREEHVHHGNQIRHDNQPENLTVLPREEHLRLHGRLGGYLRLKKTCFLPRTEIVVSVEPDGETDVYDLQMAAPGHNFVANGIIVHNCGKTKVAIDLAEAFELRLVLILCPLRVVEVWRKQFFEHARSSYYFLALDDRVPNVAAKTIEARAAHHWWAMEPGRHVAIAVNYESARREPFAPWALRIPWDLVIADESHKIKQASGQTSRFLSRLRPQSRFRLALTGTPMAHSPLDIWAQFRFLDPNILDSTYYSFRLRHGILGGYQGKVVVGYRDTDELYRKFRTLAYQVSQDVLDLPELVEEPLYTEFNPRAARMYRDMNQELIAWVASDVEVTAKNAIVKVIRLEQITSGFVYQDHDGVRETILVDNAKEKLLADFLEDLDPAEPVVVFAKFTPDLAAIRRAAEKTGRTAAEVSGTVHDKGASLAAWLRGGRSDPTVLAVQIDSGGSGLDFTRARYAVYYSMGYSLAAYLQSRSRIHRPPQTRPTAIYHLLVRGSIDETILGAVYARQDLIESILEEVKTRCSSVKIPVTR